MRHPVQPVQFERGVIRFKRNAIVAHLLDWASSRGMSLNDLAIMTFSKDDWTQFAQLIGYSVSGSGDLSYFSRKVLREATAAADALVLRRARDKKARK